MTHGMCLQCGRPQTTGAVAEGLCPHCLLQAGLGHEYAVVNVLGEGQHGTVYLAEQQPSGRLVALKILAGDSAPAIVSRLQRQAPMLSALAHPNATRTLDIALSGDPGPYVATEYRPGISDHELLRAVADPASRPAPVARGGRRAPAMHA